MAKKFKMDTREGRSGAEPGKRYFRQIESGLYLGYRRPRGSPSGTWTGRFYVGGENWAYEYERLGLADDDLKVVGSEILNFTQAVKKAQARYEARRAPALPKGPYKVSDCLDDYIEWMEAHRPRSVADARRRAEAMIKPALGKIDCAKLTGEAIERWLHKLATTAPRLRSSKKEDAKGKGQNYREVDLSNPEVQRRRRATANRTLTILKAALNRARKKKKIATDAAWVDIEPFKQVSAARPRYLSVAECKRLINASDPDFRQLVQGALTTGCRYGELAALDVAHYNRDSKTVHILTSKSGKGRDVVLNEEGARFFAALTAGRSSSEPMFKREDGERWTYNCQTRPMREAVKRAKIEPAANFHALRHTWASLSVMEGMPLMVVARNLGHSDTRMVERHYGHLAPNFIADQIRAAAPRFGFKVSGKVKEIA